MNNVSNVTDLTVVRKIRSLERSVKEWQNILNVKKSYLKQLTQYKNYSSIFNECAQLNDDIMRIEFKMGMHLQTLERLRKEL